MFFTLSTVDESWEMFLINEEPDFSPSFYHNVGFSNLLWVIVGRWAGRSVCLGVDRPSEGWRVWHNCRVTSQNINKNQVHFPFVPSIICVAAFSLKRFVFLSELVMKDRKWWWDSAALELKERTQQNQTKQARFHIHEAKQCYCGCYTCFHGKWLDECNQFFFFYFSVNKQNKSGQLLWLNKSEFRFHQVKSIEEKQKNRKY